MRPKTSPYHSVPHPKRARTPAEVRARFGWGTAVLQLWHASKTAANDTHDKRINKRI